MPEIANYDLSSSMLLARQTHDGPQLLFHSHKRRNIWRHMGGKRNPQEHSIVNAVRETEEEAGFKLRRDYLFLGSQILRPIFCRGNPQVVTVPVPVQTNVLHDFKMIDDLYIAKLHSDRRPEPTVEGESTNFIWANVDDIEQNRLDLPENLQVVSRWLVHELENMPILPMSDKSYEAVENSVVRPA